MEEGKEGGDGGKPYVHPQHMPAVKPRPPGPSRVGARRHGEVLAEERAGSRPCCPEGGFRQSPEPLAGLFWGCQSARGGFVEVAGVGLGFAHSPAGGK